MQLWTPSKQRAFQGRHRWCHVATVATVATLAVAELCQLLPKLRKLILSLEVLGGWDPMGLEILTRNYGILGILNNSIYFLGLFWGY